MCSYVRRGEDSAGAGAGGRYAAEEEPQLAQGQ